MAKRRAKPPGNCFGVNASYSMNCADGEAVCVRGELDLAASDAKIERAARRALKRIDDHYRKRGSVDSGAGPFCPPHAPQTCRPRRDLQFDTVSLRKGLTRREAAILAKAIRKTGARADIRADWCDADDIPRSGSFGRARKRRR